MRRALTLGHKGRTPLMQRCQAPRRYASFTGALTGTTDGATGSAALYHALLSSPNTTRHQSAADDGHVFARHWLPNMRTASLFVEKKREDGLFSQHRQRHHDAARARRRHSRSAQILGDKPITTAVEAVRILPALLAEAARIVELSRVQEGENTMRSAQHRRRTALSASSVFCRSVLEQALVRLYLVEGNKKKNGALDNALLDMLSPVYGVRYEALPVDLQEAMAYTLSVVMSASAFSFHLAFEQLARRKHHVPLALELFHLWWLVNPDQFVVELPDRMLPTLQSGSSAAHERGTTPGLDAITSCLRLYVSRLTNDDICAIQRQGGFLSADVLLPENYREALRSSLQQLQYRKYHVSTSLVTRVVQLCMASSTEGESGRAQEITRDVLQTYMQDILCRRSLTRDARAVGEKYDEWLLLSSVMLAVGIFERHAKLLRQLPRRSAAKRDGNDVGVSDIRCYDDLIQSIRTEWLSYISKLAQTQPHSPTPREDQEALESTMRLVFTTVSLCYETCGILNRVSANRPATASRFWQLLHERIAHTFPHVMHTGSTVSTVWALTALEGMTSCIPSGSSLPFSSVGVEHAVATWRQLTSLQHHGVTESEKEPGGTAAVVDDMKGLEKGHGIMPVAERQKRSQYVVAHVCGMDAPVVGDASLPPRSSYRYRTGFHLPLPSFASKLSAPPLLTADHTQCAASDEKTCDALAEARSSVLDVFRLHSTLPMPADPLLTLHDKNNNNNNDIFLAEEIRGMTSSPSFHVFLKLVQVLSLWGEPTNGSSHQAVPGLLFSYIEHDIAKDCKPIIAGYLKRLCVQHLAHSGLPGAVALITSHRSDMDALPPALAWNRLLHALLWSCLPASALGKLQDCLAANEEEDTSPTLLLSVLAQDGATTFNSFGSGSLAWTVIRAHCEDAHAQLSGPAPSDDGDAATEVDATAAADVKRRSSAAMFHQDALTTLSTILAHAVSLSFNISDDARRVVCLSGMTARCEWPVAGDMEPQAAADLADVADDVSGDHHSFADTTDMTAMGDENHQQHDDEDDSGEGAWLDTMDMSLETPPAADDDEMTGSPGEATKPLFAARPNDASTTEEVVDNVVDDGDGGNTSSTIDSETEGGPASGDVKCLLRHITWNPPGAQHLFFSVLQAIAWIVKPPAADRSTEAYGFLTAGAPAAERIQWARCLASNYMLALQCYLPPQDNIQNRRVDALGRRIMHDPAVLEKLMLLLLHTCPDCTLLSLMLVHWCDMRYRGELQGSTTTMEEASSFIVLPRSVEGSLCQVLYHAGITANTAQQWRQQVLGTTEGKMLSSDFQTLHALHSDAVSKHCAAVLQQSGNEEGDATPDALADAAAAELSLVLGSIALLALEQRAARIGGSPHPHNYYVYAFLKAPSSSVPSSLCASSVSAASQVVCPSQQLMSFSPVKAPPQQAQQWRETWQRGLSAPLRRRLSRNVGGSRSRVDEGQQLVRSVDTSRLVADDSDEEEGYIQRVSLF